MSRKPRWPPKPYRHSSGQGVVKIKGVPHYLGVWEGPADGDGGPEVKRNLAALLYRLEGGEPAQARERRLTVQRAVNEWLVREAPQIPSRKARDHFRLALGPFLAECGHLDVSEVGARELRAARDRMVALGWCRGHVNRQVGRVRQVWRWLEVEGLAPKGSWDHLRSLPSLRKGERKGLREAPRRKPATEEEVKAVAACARPAVAAMLWLLWWTGMRPDEVCRVRPCDVDTTGDVWVYTPAAEGEGPAHKTEHHDISRRVALGPRAQGVLAPWLARARPREYVFRPAARGHKNPRPRYAEGTFQTVVHRAAVRAGLEGWSAYTIRHAVRLRATRATSLDGARSVLGHSSLAQSLEYAEGQDLETAKEVARKIG